MVSPGKCCLCRWPNCTFCVLPVALLRGRSEARRAEARSPKGWAGGRVVGEGAVSYRGLAERCKLPQWGPLPQCRHEFWCILGSSGELSCSLAVLLDLGVIHCSFCGYRRVSYCGSEMTLSLPRFQHCGGERPRRPRLSDAFVFHNKLRCQLHKLCTTAAH